MDPAALNSLLLAALTGALGVIGTLLLRKDDRQHASATKADDVMHRQDVDLSILQANVNLLMSDRTRGVDIDSRVAMLEAWQKLYAPRIDEAHEGLRAVAIMGERIKTLFSKFDDLSRAVASRAIV